MDRRRFLLTSLAGVLAAPLAVRAQPARKIPRIGVLWHAGSAEEERIPLGAPVQGFKKLGYVEGRNVIFEHRFPNEQPERFVTLAHELVRMNVDVFIAVTRQAALAAQSATERSLSYSWLFLILSAAIWSTVSPGPAKTSRE
jgi:putative tryptophan/tyrosine transport system substrate-binding protein